MVHKIFLHFLNFILFIFFWGGGGLVHSECPVTTHVSYSASFVPISLFFRHQFINHYNCSCDHSHLCWYALYLQIWRQLIRLLWINCKSTNVWLVLVLFLFCFCFVFFYVLPVRAWLCFLRERISAILHFFLLEIPTLQRGTKTLP